ncbi:hypothetical protein RRF57_005550 [Xylaria bambusicola]|uniref:Uncharacterized protein n=1 Tax=Xylaria bambusicola TaxID=326684 RepID=A0AAN7UCT4_9PEZI
MWETDANLTGFSRSQKWAMRVEEWYWMPGKWQDSKRCGGLNESEKEAAEQRREADNTSETRVKLVYDEKGRNQTPRIWLRIRVIRIVRVVVVIVSDEGERAGSVEVSR